MTEDAIVTGLRKRDESTIDHVMVRYAKLLWPIVYSVLKNVGSEQDMEECVADVFIGLWEDPGKFHPERGSLKSWLCMRARCIAIDRYRVLSRSRTVSLEDAMLAGRIGVQDALLREETKQELIAAVNALAEQERDILIRRYYYEQKPREIARALELTVKQVDNSLYRSKKKLRNAL